MSEPITRAEFRDFLIHKERVDLLHPSTSPALIFDSWCEQRRTESAPPPRALVGITGPVLPYESGPGQPTDLAAQLENDASAWEEAALAADEYDHAPEGMRETAALEREAAAEIRRLRAESESRYRAGVEAAARYHDAKAISAENRQAFDTARRHNADAAAIRALADAPPVDPLLAGLKYALQLIEGGRQSVYADSTWDAAAHRRSGDKYFALLNAEIAARKGG